MDEKNLDVKLALEEMRLNMQHIMLAGDTLDQKVESTLVAAGLVLGLATILQASLSSSYPDLSRFVVILAILSYVICVSLILVSTIPRTYHLPIASERKELEKQILGESEREAIMNVLVGYIDQSQYNEGINKRKARLHVCSLVVLAVTILLVVVLLAIM